MKPPLKKPCKQCPFRVKSAPGYLGASVVNDFLATTMSDAEMLCHSTVNYEDPFWQSKLDKARLCAGSVIFYANILKMSRRPDAPVLSKSEEVFKSPKDFLKHHGGTTDGFIACMYGVRR